MYFAIKLKLVILFKIFFFVIFLKMKKMYLLIELLLVTYFEIRTF